MVHSHFKSVIVCFLAMLMLFGVVPSALAAEETTPPDVTVAAEPTNQMDLQTPEVTDSNTDDPLGAEDMEVILEEVYELAATDGQVPSMLPASYIQSAISEKLNMPSVMAMAMSRAAQVTPVSEPRIVVPQTWYKLYWQNGSTWQKWGDYWIQMFPFFNLSNGQTGYCIEPFNSNAAVGSSRVPVDWDGIECQWSKYGGVFEQEKRQGIALSLAYGAPNNGKTSNEAKFATAAMVWDMATGTRKPNGDLRFGNSSPFGRVLKNNQSSVYAEYEELLTDIKNHGKIPSFSAKFSTKAPTYQMEYNSGTGNYEVSLYDSNDILDHFNYSSSISGLSFSKDGNTLNISATPEAAAQLGGGTVASSRGHDVSVGPDTCAVWTSAAGSDTQIMVSLTDNVDPTPSYFKLKAETFGTAKFIKSTNTGGSLGGWKISLYRDAGCSDLVGTYTTGSDGTVTTGNLIPGTYYAKEVDESSSYPYWRYDSHVETVVIRSAETAEAHFHNDQFGRIRFTKSTNTGRDLGGWTVYLYRDSGCSDLVDTYTTGSDGTVTTGNLWPGTYYAVEASTTDPYWTTDGSVKTITVEAGQTISNATTVFTNTQYGRVQFRKTTNTGEHLEHWTFNLYRNSNCTDLVGSYTTGADGTVTTGNLLPGTYYAAESAIPDSYWECDNSVKTIIVTAGKTTSATDASTFHNIHYGRARIRKTMATDGPLEGWVFKVTDANGTEIAGSPFTTNSEGVFETANLLPGTYTVTEIIPENSLYYCKSENPQTVTVSAGSTAEVMFTNALRPGKIQILKTDHMGNTLSGAKFCLEWSKDGSPWKPVFYSDKEDVVLGGCSASTENGCLVTGADGLAEWGNLYPGIDYRITEVEAPAGYQLLKDTAWEGQLPVEDLTVQLNVVNHPVLKLPETGSHAMIKIPIALAACGAVCLGAILYLKKKRG